MFAFDHLVTGFSIPQVQEYVKKYATEDALRNSFGSESERNGDDSDSESSMSEFSDDDTGGSSSDQITKDMEL